MSLMSTLNVRSRPLQEVLHVANMRAALLAVVLFGLPLFVLGLFMLRFYMLDNLQLSARTMAYTVEAAVVFGDAEAAASDLRSVAAGRTLAAAYVLDHSGKVIARWEAQDDDLWSVGERLLAGIFLDEPAVAEIHYSGRRVGSVRLYGAGHDLLRFLMISIACGILALGVSIWAASRLSRRDGRQIVMPLLKFEQLAYQASRDGLTGLFNRDHFEKQAAEVADLLRGTRRLAAIFFIDVDYFKSINDTYGHEVGDVVLRAIARRLRARVREDDMVARLGGDEFAALFYPLDDPAQAQRIAQSMIDGMRQPISLHEGATLQTSLSIGVAFLPAAPNDTLAGWVKCADQAMYAAKRAGRGRYEVYSEKTE